MASPTMKGTAHRFQLNLLSCPRLQCLSHHHCQGQPITHTSPISSNPFSAQGSIAVGSGLYYYIQCHQKGGKKCQRTLECHPKGSQHILKAQHRGETGSKDGSYSFRGQIKIVSIPNNFRLCWERPLFPKKTFFIKDLWSESEVKITAVTLGLHR